MAIESLSLAKPALRAACYEGVSAMIALARGTQARKARKGVRHRHGRLDQSHDRTQRATA